MASAETSNYGRRLPCHVVDEVAATDPNRPFAFAARSNVPEDGWTAITYAQLANAVNVVAHLVAEKVKASSDEPMPTVAYVGPNDIRYPVLVLACIKAGCQALLISPRNSLAAQLNLFQATNCEHLWFPEGPQWQSVVAPWLEHRQSMQIFHVPRPDSWLNQPAAEPFPYEREFAQGRFDPLVVLHTSGSTGLPKPVIVRQGCAAVADGLRLLEPYHGADFAWKGLAARSKRMLMPMPLFHAAGMLGCTVMLSIMYGVPMAYAIPDQPLTPDFVVRCIQGAEVDSVLLPPSLLESMGNSPECVEVLKSLNFTLFGGGNLANSIGDRLVEEGVFIINIISSTELYPYGIMLQHNSKLWNYFIFHSKAMGAEWACRDENEGIYEMFIRRKDASDPVDQPLFYNFPNLESDWSTGDLYKKHPSLEDHWMYYGRADNIIVFSNGEKLNPVTIEDTITGHPSIKGALVVGQDRFQPALILEPVQAPASKEDGAALIDAVWPLVAAVNEQTVAHGRIVRPLVALSLPDIPFERASKGTIQRGLTVKGYAEYIDSIFLNAESADVEEPVALDLTSTESATGSILQMLQDRFGIPDAKIASDMTTLGIDSLQIIRMASVLRSSLKAIGMPVDKSMLDPRSIYASPTPQQLGLYLSTLAAGEITKTPALSEAEGQIAELQRQLTTYTSDLPSAPESPKPPPQNTGQVVIVTGTTGSLGSYLIDLLINSPRVARILALNRGADGGAARQLTANASRGLTTDFAKVQFCEADVSLPDLGLPSSVHEELLVDADRIIHNAWPVNFNLSIASFEPHVRGVRHLVDFSFRARKIVPIIFVSSVSTVGNWKGGADPVPEKPLEDLSLADMGYGRSKLAGSLILDEAATRSGVPSTTVRVGQIAGPRKRSQGVWNKKEYIPALVASSVYLGKLPESIGPGDVVDWMPVEDVAGLLLDVAGILEDRSVADICGYYHAVSPVPAAWKDVANAILEFYPGKISLVKFEDWLSALERSASSTADVERNPGIKLLDTYRAMVAATKAGVEHVSVDMERTMADSETARHAGPVTADLVKRWCQQWEFH